MSIALPLSSPRDATIRTDRQFLITEWNDRAETLFGYRPTEVIGQPLQLLSMPSGGHDETTLLTRVITEGTTETLETVRMTKAGSPVTVLLTCAPMRNAGGHIAGVDITARELTEA